MDCGWVGVELAHSVVEIPAKCVQETKAESERTNSIHTVARPQQQQQNFTIPSAITNR